MEMAKKKKTNKKKNKPNKKSKLSFRVLFLLLIFMIFALLYMPMAILFFVGMLPTLVVYFTDRVPGKNKTFTIGAMNFAGCFYYMLSMWSTPKPMQLAVDYLSDPMTIVIIYSAAVVGYIVDSVATLSVASILRQKSQVRLQKLESNKKKLEKRWGEKVNGDRPLDAQGFLLKNNET